MHLNKISMAIIGLSSMGYAQASGGSESFWMWIAIILGITSIAIVFIASHKAQKVQQLHQALFDKQLEMEKNQNLLLTNMSENIHDIAKQALEKSHQLSKPFKNKDEILTNVENRLLDVTNDLIDFLRLKSKKVEIVNEEFNINNVLNEL